MHIDDITSGGHVHPDWQKHYQIREFKPRLPVTTTTQQYKMVSASESKKFEALISFHLAEGWSLYGSPVITNGPTNNHIIYGQALVKDEVQVGNG